VFRKYNPVKRLSEVIFIRNNSSFGQFVFQFQSGANSGVDWGNRPPLKIYESNLNHNDFVQFGTQHIKTNSE